jgi:2'-5' RNA ligase
MFYNENGRPSPTLPPSTGFGHSGRHNLFFALLPEPVVVSQVSDLGTRVCGAHRFRGNPIWPDRLHITLLSALDGYCSLPENIDRAAQAGARVDAAAFDVAFDITESFFVRSASHPFVLTSGKGLAAAAWLRQLIVVAMIEEGFEVPISSGFTPHMTLMWTDRWVEQYPTLPIRWTVREFALVLSHIGESRHEYLARWKLRDGTE